MTNDELILEIIEKVHEQGKSTADKVDNIQVELARQSETLKINTASLEEHVKRTNLLEDQISGIDKKINMVESILKFVGFLAVITGIVEGIVSIIHR